VGELWLLLLVVVGVDVRHCEEGGGWMGGMIHARVSGVALGERAGSIVSIHER
jgi:hypothetical protein